MVLTPGDDVGEQLWALAYKYVERGAVGGLLLVMMTKISETFGKFGRQCALLVVALGNVFRVQNTFQNIVMCTFLNEK